MEQEDLGKDLNRDLCSLQAVLESDDDDDEELSGYCVLRILALNSTMCYNYAMHLKKTSFLHILASRH